MKKVIKRLVRVRAELNNEPDEKTSEPELGDKDSDHKPSALSAQPDNTAEDAQATSGIDEVKEAVAHYADEPSPMANSRIQTELLAKISSMLENAERESAQVESLSAQKTSTADSSVQNSTQSSQSQKQHSNDHQALQLQALQLQALQFQALHG